MSGVEPGDLVVTDIDTVLTRRLESESTGEEARRRLAASAVDITFTTTTTILEDSDYSNSTEVVDCWRMSCYRRIYIYFDPDTCRGFRRALGSNTDHSSVTEEVVPRALPHGELGNSCVFWW